MPIGPNHNFNMHRYIPGIILVQLLTAILLWVNYGADTRTLLLQVALPALLLSLVCAFWFASIGRSDAERVVTRLRLEHAKEREKLNISAEKTRAKVLEQSHKAMRKQERSIGRKASLKVGLAFSVTAIAGVLMLITELITFGLMTITTALGGVGGYFARVRQTRNSVQPVVVADDPLIDASTALDSLPAPKNLPENKSE